MRGAREEKPRRIGQGEVERLLVLREQAREARAMAVKMEKELREEEDRLTTILQAGGQVEFGPYFLVAVRESTGRSVAWRKVVEEHLGKSFAERVLAATPPGERPVLKVLREVTVDGAAAKLGGVPTRGVGRERGNHGTSEAE